MTIKYDVIIIGAGPAGLMAAKTAAENGLSVALLERKTDIPKIRRVDGGGIGVNEYLFEQMVIFNPPVKRLCFPVAGFSIPYDGPYSNIYGIQIHSPGGRRILFGDWNEARRKGDEVRVGICLSKEILLKGLLNECLHFGVEVSPGTNVTDIKQSDNTVVVIGNGETFKGTFAIAADGVNSRIARILGFNKERRFLGTQNTVTWTMEGKIPIDPGSLNFTVAQKGIFSVMPTDDEGMFHVSTFTSNPQVDLNAALDRFMREDKTYFPWFTNARRVDVTSCVVNRLSAIKEPFRDNTLLIGDAAWVQEFSNMAALSAGWKSAHAITLALMDGKIGREGIQSYMDWWERYFYGPYGGYDLGGGGDLQEFLSDEEIDYLAGLVSEPQPATMNFFVFSQLGRIYSRFLPRIRDERPGLLEKLMEMEGKMKDKMEEQVKAGFPNR